MTVVMSQLSKETIRVEVKASDAGVPTDPTAYTVHMAFKPEGVDPADADWIVASWDTVGARYFAQAVIGEGTPTDLEPGRYAVWVRVTTPSERPVLVAPDFLDVA